MSATVTCTLKDRLCRPTLARPDKLNTLTMAMFEEIDAHLGRHEDISAGAADDNRIANESAYSLSGGV